MYMSNQNRADTISVKCYYTSKCASLSNLKRRSKTTTPTTPRLSSHLISFFIPDPHQGSSGISLKRKRESVFQTFILYRVTHTQRRGVWYIRYPHPPPSLSANQIEQIIFIFVLIIIIININNLGIQPWKLSSFLSLSRSPCFFLLSLIDRTPGTPRAIGTLKTNRLFQRKQLTFSSSYEMMYVHIHNPKKKKAFFFFLFLLDMNLFSAEFSLSS